MAVITDADTAWSAPITLTTDEIWQARRGSAFVTTTADPDDDDGMLLLQYHAVRLPAGADVRYRKQGSETVVIVHEAV